MHCLCFSRAYEEYQVETVYESVADLQFTHMASALISDAKGKKKVPGFLFFLLLQEKRTAQQLERNEESKVQKSVLPKLLHYPTVL